MKKAFFSLLLAVIAAFMAVSPVMAEEGALPSSPQEYCRLMTFQPRTSQEAAGAIKELIPVVSALEELLKKKLEPETRKIVLLSIAIVDARIVELLRVQAEKTFVDSDPVINWGLIDELIKVFPAEK